MKCIWSEQVDSILSVGHSLTALGVNNWALSKELSFLALEQFLFLGIAILGGDVCEMKDGIIQYNYDSWHCELNEEESDEDFLKRSIAKTREYITIYNSLHSDDVFFVIVPLIK